MLTSNHKIVDRKDFKVINKNYHGNSYKRKISDDFDIKQYKLLLNVQGQLVQLNFLWNDQFQLMSSRNFWCYCEKDKLFYFEDWSPEFVDLSLFLSFFDKTVYPKWDFQNMIYKNREWFSPFFLIKQTFCSVRLS